jgi:hypothetical protein
MAQQQTSVKVDDKDYTVTEFPGRSMHMVQLSGPEGAAMVTVQNGKITAYISPPGGGGKQDLINKVWGAYQDQKKGNAVANSNATPARGTNSDDPNAAARAEMMARANAVIAAAGNLGRANPLAPANLTVEFPAGGGAIVHGTKHGDVTFLAADGADVRAVQPTVSGTPLTYVARYEGGDTPGSAASDLGKFGESFGKALLFAYSSRAVHIIGNNDRYEVYEVSESRGKEKVAPLLEAGGVTSSITGRDPGGSIGNDVLDTVWKAEQFAMTSAKARNDAGQAVSFDPQSTPRGKRAFEWFKKYEHAN